MSAFPVSVAESRLSGHDDEADLKTCQPVSLATGAPLQSYASAYATLRLLLHAARRADRAEIRSGEHVAEACFQRLRSKESAREYTVGAVSA
jgi:hypothetical protein